MSRNAESRFSQLPSVDISRSKFNRDSSVKTSFNIGELIPFYVDEVLPGDTFQIDTSKVVRLQTMLTPIMDNIYLDTYWFFVPNRIVWDHWREFNGENTQSAWTQSIEYEVPQLTAPEGGWNVGTLADYFGIPVGVDNISVNALPFRAYTLIVNEWFRDQNLVDPLNFSKGDTTVAGVNTGTFVTDVAKGGLPFIAAKYHDYFSSCLPSPQKGSDVMIPVAEAAPMPVYAFNDFVPDQDNYYAMVSAVHYNGGNLGYRIRNQNGAFSTSVTDGEVPLVSATDPYPSSPVNLWAVSDGNATAATINQLRLAFQIQKLYERDARGG